MYTVVFIPEETQKYLRREYWCVKTPGGVKFAAKFNTRSEALEFCQELNVLLKRSL